MYRLKGDGIPCYKREAFKWYKMSAEQGECRGLSYNHRAYVLQPEKGVLVNKKEAFKWYKKNADQGDARAQYNIGAYCFYNGERG